MILLILGLVIGIIAAVIFLATIENDHAIP